MLCAQCSPNFKALDKLKAARARERMRANELLQREELRSLSKSASEELRVYEKELTRLRFLVRYVQSQKQELQREKTMIDSLDAPIRLLPPELLEKIFVHYVDAVGGNIFGSRPKAIIPAAVLAAVCKQWHTLTFHSARLWCRITIYFGSEYEAKVSYLSTVIGRSMTTNSSRMPLRIHLTSEKDELFECKDQDIPMLQAIAKECDRWSTLISDIDGNFAMSEPLQQIKGHLDHLWCLDIQQRVWKARGQTLPMFSEAPKLRTLHFDVLHHMPRVDVPLSQAKTMSVRLWGTVDFEIELPFCKNATNLTVNLADGFSAESPKTRFVLQCMELTVDASDHYGSRDNENNFFAGIQCPSLESMKLMEKNDTCSTKPFSIFELHPFLVASGQRLRSLDIATFPVKNVNELIAAFAAMPLLEAFTITEGCPACCPNCSGTTESSKSGRESCYGRNILNADLLRALTVPRSDGFTSNVQVVLPNLKTLQLTASRMQEDFEFNLLADMLSSRCFVNEGFVKLEKVKLAFPRMTMKSLDIGMLRWLCEAGVYLAVYDKDRRVI